MAFAWVPKGAPVTWADGMAPAQTLWIPEELVDALRAWLGPSSLLSSLNIYKQNRLPLDSATRLFAELAPLANDSADPANVAAARICALGTPSDGSAGFELLVEGP